MVASEGISTENGNDQVSTRKLPSINRSCVSISVTEIFGHGRPWPSSSLLKFSIRSISPFPFSAQTLLVVQQEAHTACKKIGYSLLVMTM